MTIKKLQLFAWVFRSQLGMKRKELEVRLHVLRRHSRKTKKATKTEEVLTASLAPEKKTDATSAPKAQAPLGTTYALVSPPPAPVPLAIPYAYSDPQSVSYGVPLPRSFAPVGSTYASAPSATKARAPVGTTYAKAAAPVGTTYQSAPPKGDFVTLTFHPGIVGIIQEGALAKEVQEGSQAERAGVQAGWKITAVDGKMCESFLDATFKDAAHGTTPYTITFAKA